MSFIRAYSIGLQLLVCAFALGCGGFLAGAKTAYHEGRYLEAAEDLGEHEREVRDLPPESQAEYGLYRGLSLIKVQDYQGAMQWLGYAIEIEKKNPGSLKAEQKAELEQNFAQVKKMLESPAQPDAQPKP